MIDPVVKRKSRKSALVLCDRIFSSREKKVGLNVKLRRAGPVDRLRDQRRLNLSPLALAIGINHHPPPVSHTHTHPHHASKQVWTAGPRGSCS